MIRSRRLPVLVPVVASRVYALLSSTLVSFESFVSGGIVSFSVKCPHSLRIVDRLWNLHMR